MISRLKFTTPHPWLLWEYGVRACNFLGLFSPQWGLLAAQDFPVGLEPAHFAPHFPIWTTFVLRQSKRGDRRRSAVVEGRLVKVGLGLFRGARLKIRPIAIRLVNAETRRGSFRREIT